MNKAFVLLILFSGLSLAAEKTNVLFILSDNQSYYEMACHGHQQVKTPHIDKLASQSVDFQHFYAPPYCSPSRSVILTGQYALRSGVHDTIGGRSIMHRDQATLADIMKENGYATGVFGKWHLGFSYPHRPQDRGFDEVFIHGGGGVGQMEDYYGNTLFDTTFIHNEKVTPVKGYCTDSIFTYAMKFIENNKSKPFFCFVSTPVTHSPHHGPKDLVAELKADGVKGNVELFGQIQNLDMNIGRILKQLEDLGLSKNTLVIFASDQGMNDRGAPHGDNRKGNQHDPAHHVPFMVRLNGAKPTVNKRIAGMVDFFPSVLDICGIELPKNCDGLSLKPLLTGTKGYPDDRTLIIQCPRGRISKKWQKVSIKTDRWRLVDGKVLYDIKADPRQKNDIAKDHPDVVSLLRAKYEEYWQTIPDQETTLSRHLIGHRECPETVLNGMDWYQGSRPWNKGAFKRPGNGVWALTVVTDGKYRVECRSFPREADKEMQKTNAKLQIGEVIKKIAFDQNAKSATFEVELKAGDYDMKTWLYKKNEQEGGALFVYVKKLKNSD